MGKILKELSGHSGSKIYLMQDEQKLFVRKVDNVQRNYERMSTLKGFHYPVPEIFDYDGVTMDMQYIRGLDMKNYLIHNNINLLLDFLCDIIDNFSDNFVLKNYAETYENKLSWMTGKEGFNFTREELIRCLPKKLPKTIYHGDLTLENILYTDSGFYFIDPLTSEYDSYIFDIAKLRQDLECKWFIRNTDVKIDVKLQKIHDKLKRRYPEAFDDDILILMLLRVYPYCNEQDKRFILNEANRLWK